MTNRFPVLLLLLQSTCRLDFTFHSSMHLPIFFESEILIDKDPATAAKEQSAVYSWHH